MTTAAAANLYLAQHLMEMEGKGYAIYNPENKPVAELPVIYGFNNGGSPGWYSAQLIAEDGTGMGGHICSEEGYMLHDLGILQNTRSDRHEGFREHYPTGYRMEFIPTSELKSHPGLAIAFKRNQELAKSAAQQTLNDEQPTND